MENNIEKIKNILDVFFKNCHIRDFDIDIKNYDSDTRLVITVSLPTTASIFIGRYGSNLEAFENVLTDVANLNNNTEKRCKVEFDINGYRLNRQKELQDLAKKTAQKVMVFKVAVKLEPMSARDRKTIHNEISLYPDLHSWSEGENPNRRIVIGYREQQ